MTWLLFVMARRSGAMTALQMPVRSDMFKRALSEDGFVSAKAVDCSQAVREICELQKCRPVPATALGRALASVLLIADGGADEETFQARFAGDGPLGGVFALANGRLEARGYVGNPQMDLDVSVKQGIGNGQLKVVRLKNLPGEEKASPFSSIVDIVSGEIAEDINHYVATSEQREGALAAGVALDDDAVVAAAGGWRLELLPGAPDNIVEQVIENISRLLASRVSTTDMLLRGSSLDDVLTLLLAGLGPTIFPDADVPRFRCECSVDRVYRTLALLPRSELQHILDTQDRIEAKCEFCARVYGLPHEAILRHIAKVDSGAIIIE